MTISNILAIYNLSSAAEIKSGLAWYSDAHNEALVISERHNIPLTTVIGVIAALSPNNKWRRNLDNADALIAAYLDGETVESVKVSTYHTMKDKAWSILADQLDETDDILTRLNGQKIKSFYECILGIVHGICIDGHALNIWRNERHGLTSDKTNIGKRLYADIQADYLEAGKAVTYQGRKLTAYEMQAVTWTVWRRIWGIV
jgi:hypothetical protein